MRRKAQKQREQPNSAIRRSMVLHVVRTRARLLRVLLCLSETAARRCCARTFGARPIAAFACLCYPWHGRCRPRALAAPTKASASSTAYCRDPAFECERAPILSPNSFTETFFTLVGMILWRR